MTLIISNGIHTLISAAIPTVRSTSVAAVAVCSWASPVKFPYIVISVTTIKSVSPVGSAFNTTLRRKSPLIRLLLGCNARKNAGIPIVNIPRNDNCVGYNGYRLTDISVNIVSIIENIFFARNNDAERLILLTTLLPSPTTSGILEKSESRSTIWAALLAASLPDAIATLQSAHFKASTSLTPSPVIATTFPAALNASIIFFFCSGITLPKTVYFSTACVISSSVFKVVAST